MLDWTALGKHFEGMSLAGKGRALAGRRGWGGWKQLLGLGKRNSICKGLVVLQVWSQMRSVGITRGLAENSDSRTALPTYQSESSGGGRNPAMFRKVFQVILTHPRI